MEPLSHFIGRHGAVKPEQLPGKRFPSRNPTNLSISSPSRSESLLAVQINPSSACLMRSLSSSSLQGMSHENSNTSIGDCLAGDASLEECTENSHNPRRNLTEAFEELYVEPTSETSTPGMTTSSDKAIQNTTVISPTGVADIALDEAASSCDKTPEHSNIVTPCVDNKRDEMKLEQVPHFCIHIDLKRDLTQALINRVSFYGVIHDINKEASAMAANDESAYNRNPEDQSEEHDPLVISVNGHPKEPLPSSNTKVKIALIDEERWLLDAIDSRSSDESRSVQACPPTFLQAMGERDYENPLASLSNGSRTQLWKPSRSWWEAKSGKNPWIEPKSHNKRWRYLWPLIHYHKFLARCIKKLKRNGVDVKTSVSPVSVFLREEVCAVSDHLAAVSLFDSDEWMNCLKHFNGWTDSDEKAEARVRELVSRQKLRSLTEPGDVDSPLLRSQIDQHFLRAMASARSQMVGTGMQPDRGRTKESLRLVDGEGQDEGSNPTTDSLVAPQGGEHQFPAHSRTTASPSCRTSQRPNGSSPGGVRRNRLGYPPHQGVQWWTNGWNPHIVFPYGDDTSVHSALSGDSFSQHYEYNGYPAGSNHHSYYPHMAYHHYSMAMNQAQQPAVYDSMTDPSFYALGNQYNPEQMAASCWMGHPMGDHSFGYVPSEPPSASAAHMNQPPGTPCVPTSPLDMHAHHASQPEALVDQSQPTPCDHTPFRYNPTQIPMSPYWGHLDHATLAMMGIASPQGNPAPQTPSRMDGSSAPDGMSQGVSDLKEQGNGVAMNAQPLLLRQPYYGYGYGAREGYGPPSPATQFMMSPQANFAYNYGYGYSPRRPGSQGKRLNKEPAVAEENLPKSNDAVAEESNKVLTASVTPPPSSSKNRESPATVETTAESESLEETA